MEVENASKNKLDAGVSLPSNNGVQNSPNNKKKKIWMIVLGALSALIVILIIVIVVVAVNRNNKGETEEVWTVNTSDEEAMDIYDEVANEIALKILDAEGGATDEQILGLYRSYISKTRNEKAKALLSMDYYTAVMGSDYNLGKKEEVLNGLTAVDTILKSPSSAYALATAASYYNEFTMAEEYNEIMQERMGDDEAE